MLSERPIARNEILVRARVVGGPDEADDKIIAVLDNDYSYGSAREIEDVPKVLVNTLSTSSAPRSTTTRKVRLSVRRAGQRDPRARWKARPAWSLSPMRS